MPTTQETIGEIKQLYMKLKLEALSLRATLPADSATSEKLAEVCEKLSEAVRVLQNVPDSVPLPAIVMPTILHLTSLNKLITQLNKDKSCFSLIENFNGIQQTIELMFSTKTSLARIAIDSKSDIEASDTAEKKNKPDTPPKPSKPPVPPKPFKPPVPPKPSVLPKLSVPEDKTEEALLSRQESERGSTESSGDHSRSSSSSSIIESVASFFPSENEPSLDVESEKNEHSRSPSPVLN